MSKGDSSSFGCLSVLAILAVIALLIRYAPVLFTIIKIGIIVSVVMIIIGIILVIYFSMQKSTPKAGKKDSVEPQMQNQTETDSAETAPNLTDEQKTALNAGRANLMELRRKSVKIRHNLIHSVTEQICTTAEKIIETLREKPDAISQARQFLNYYLPTIVNILSKYIRLETNGTPDPETTETTLTHLIDIKHALDNQHKALYEDDKFDLSVEMEALKLACLRDGLLTEEDFQTQKENDTKPDLTL